MRNTKHFSSGDYKKSASSARSIMSLINQIALRTIFSLSATLTLFDTKVGSSPLFDLAAQPLKSTNSSSESEEEKSIGSEQGLIQLRDSDKNLLRAVAIFIGILVVFSMIICLCATYWCICWALQCPGVNTMRALSRAASRPCNRLRSSRLRRNPGKSKKGGKRDLPPPYETICIMPAEEFGFVEEDPPTYYEALSRETGAV